MNPNLKKELLANVGCNYKTKKRNRKHRYLSFGISVGRGNDKKYVSFADSELIGKILDTWTLQPDRI